jgi:hypothetical protein
MSLDNQFDIKNLKDLIYSMGELYFSWFAIKKKQKNKGGNATTSGSTELHHPDDTAPGYRTAEL